MIVGANPKNEDITVNVCKKKHATNTRASGSDDALKLVPHSQLSLEQCLEFIAEDELVEVTPKSIRMRQGHPLQGAAHEAGQQEEVSGGGTRAGGAERSERKVFCGTSAGRTRFLFKKASTLP